jgi:hypothetical protein
MRRPKLTILAVALLLSGAILAAQQNNAPLTNNDVVKMVVSGMPETTIVNAIAANDTQFDLSASGLQSLSAAGVSSKVVRAMLAAESKKKDAAAPRENTATPDTSSGQTPPAGMPDMAQMGISPQMLAQMPPAARARMEAAMARRRGPGGGGASAGPSVPSSSRPGIPVPLDSPLYTSFMRLQAQSGYRMIMNMQTNDPRLQQAMAQAAFKPAELIVQGDTRQYTMHYQMPAMDRPGTVDDWEIRAVVRNGRAARLFTSPAVPRLLKLNEEKAAQQLAMLDMQAASAIAHAAAEGPMGAIGAGMTAASTAIMHVEVPKMLKRERDMFSWKCGPAPQSGGPGGRSATQLTDFHPIDDQIVDGRAAAAYEFYAYDNAKTQGTVRLLVAKDTGLPMRIEMGDPNTTGAMQMVYSELSSPVQIEVPSCMANAQ